MKEKVKGIFRKILDMQGDPKKIAFACALGVFIAFFPILGTHTALAFALAWVFRVSPAVTLGASFVNNPWTIAPMYGGSLWFGVLITGTDISSVNIDWHGINWEVFVKLVKVIGVPFVAGCLVLGLVFAVIAYFAALKAVLAYRARKESVARATE